MSESMQGKPGLFAQVNTWLREILQLFRKAPGKWMLLGLAHVFLFVMIPGLLGIKFISFLLLPTFLAIVMGFYRNADQGLYADLGDLLNEVKPTFRKLLSLGAICVFYVFLINLLTADDATRLQEFAKAEPSAEEMMAQFGPVFLKLMLLLLPLVLLIWFSPMLVAYQQYSVIRAIKSSLAAVIQYLLPLLLTWLGVTLIIMLSMTLSGVLVAIVSAFSSQVGGLLMLVLVFSCMLLASALMFAFQYISNRDIFRVPPAVVQEEL